jgi:hypothetical protein
MTNLKFEYTPPKVSKYFKYDWQFAVEMSRVPLLRPASIVIGFMPLITNASETLFGISFVSIPWSLWIMWWASLSFIASWIILKFNCPDFIQQYQDYDQYKKKQHSHRWILWLFYSNITKLTSWEVIVQETLAKEISILVDPGEPPEVHGLQSWMVRKKADDAPANFNPTDENTVTIFYPENIKRDLYVPIAFKTQGMLLLLREEDPDLNEKEKELFWILFTQAAKEKPVSRTLFWIFLYLSFLLLGLNVLKNIFAVMWWVTLGELWPSIESWMMWLEFGCGH